MTAAIEVEQLSKRYLLGEGAGLGRSLKGTLRSVVRREAARAARDEIWALRDVSLSVEQGEVFGIIGANGAGKSTLLKILARVTEPTTGRARVRGRIGALLEVGTGFEADLTGRENIYLNGTLIGMTRAEIDRKFADIVEFAGLERFLDTPLKRYSSGMELRLGFSIAAHLDPDVMAVDEALTVGDVEFQRRCVEKIEAIQRDGRTIIFVSHDLGALGKLCGRVVWLQKGQVRELGAAKTVIDAYLHETIAGNALAGFGDDPDAVVGLRAVRLVDRAGAIVPAPRRGDEVDLAVTLDVRRGVVTDTAFHITNDLGIRIIDDVLSDGRPAMAERYDPGRYEFRMSIPPLLAPGEYTVNFWMGDYEVDHVHRDVLRFRVLPRFDDRAETATRDRLIVPQVRWEVRPA